MARKVKRPGNSNLIIKNKSFELWNPCSQKQHCPINKHARNVKCAGNSKLIIKKNPSNCGINAAQNNTVQLTSMGWTCYSNIRNMARNVKCVGNSKLMIKNKFFELWNPCSIKQHCPLIKHGIDILK